MRRLLSITTAFAALLLTACGQRLDVRPALPVCPQPIVLPKSMTVMPMLPSWFPLPTTPALPKQPVKPSCVSPQAAR